MDKESDPHFQEAKGRAQRIESAYGDLGRHAVGNTGVSDAHAFTAALERLGILELPPVALIPRNLDTAPTADNLVYERESKDLQAIANQLAINLAPLTGVELNTIHENDATTILAGIYIAIESVNHFATLVEFFTNVAKVFGSRRAKDGSEVELYQEVVIKTHSTVKRLSYKGPASGLPEIVNLMQSESGKDENA